MDTHGIIAKVNGGFSETIGYTQEEIELSSLEQFLLTSVKYQFIKNVLKRLFLERTQYAYTYIYYIKMEDHVYISLNMIPANLMTKCIGVFAIAKDITDI